MNRRTGWFQYTYFIGGGGIMNEKTGYTIADTAYLIHDLLTTQLYVEIGLWTKSLKLNHNSIQWSSNMQISSNDYDNRYTLRFSWLHIQ